MEEDQPMQAHIQQMSNQQQPLFTVQQEIPNAVLTQNRLSSAGAQASSTCPSSLTCADLEMMFSQQEANCFTGRAESLHTGTCLDVTQLTGVPHASAHSPNLVQDLSAPFISTTYSNQQCNVGIENKLCGPSPPSAKKCRLASSVNLGLPSAEQNQSCQHTESKDTHKGVKLQHSQVQGSESCCPSKQRHRVRTIHTTITQAKDSRCLCKVQHCMKKVRGRKRNQKKRYAQSHMSRPSCQKQHTTSVHIDHKSPTSLPHIQTFLSPIRKNDLLSATACSVNDVEEDGKQGLNPVQYDSVSSVMADTDASGQMWYQCKTKNEQLSLELPCLTHSQNLLQVTKQSVASSSDSQPFWSNSQKLHTKQPCCRCPTKYKQNNPGTYHASYGVSSIRQETCQLTSPNKFQNCRLQNPARVRIPSSSPFSHAAKRTANPQLHRPSCVLPAAGWLTRSGVYQTSHRTPTFISMDPDAFCQQQLLTTSGEPVKQQLSLSAVLPTAAAHDTPTVHQPSGPLLTAGGLCMSTPPSVATGTQEACLGAQDFFSPPAAPGLAAHNIQQLQHHTASQSLRCQHPSATAAVSQVSENPALYQESLYGRHDYREMQHCQNIGVSQEHALTYGQKTRTRQQSDLHTTCFSNLGYTGQCPEIAGAKAEQSCPVQAATAKVTHSNELNESAFINFDEQQCMSALPPIQSQGHGPQPPQPMVTYNVLIIVSQAPPSTNNAGIGEQFIFNTEALQPASTQLTGHNSNAPPTLNNDKSQDTVQETYIDHLTVGSPEPERIPVTVNEHGNPEDREGAHRQRRSPIRVDNEDETATRSVDVATSLLSSDSSDSDSSMEPIEVVYCHPESSMEKGSSEQKHLHASHHKAKRKQHSAMVTDQEQLRKMMPHMDDTLPQNIPLERSEGSAMLVPIRGNEAMQLVLPGEEMEQFTRRQTHALQKDEVVCVCPM